MAMCNSAVSRDWRERMKFRSCVHDEAARGMLMDSQSYRCILLECLEEF
jgi:hypothetical protein